MLRFKEFNKGGVGTSFSILLDLEFGFGGPRLVKDKLAGLAHGI